MKKNIVEDILEDTRKTLTIKEQERKDLNVVISLSRLIWKRLSLSAKTEYIVDKGIDALFDIVLDICFFDLSVLDNNRSRLDRVKRELFAQYQNQYIHEHNKSKGPVEVAKYPRP